MQPEAFLERVTTRCTLCGAETPYLGTKLCDRCWSIDSAVRRDPDLAVRILAGLQRLPVDIYGDVQRFNQAVIPGVDRSSVGPSAPPTRDLLLGVRLIHEEWEELLTATRTYINFEEQVLKDNGGPPDIVATADAIADMLYVVIGLALRFGMDRQTFARVWLEVTRSNMAKAGGPTREDGKRLKPEGWTPPRVAEALAGEL